jgi:hypothetical protein
MCSQGYASPHIASLLRCIIFLGRMSESGQFLPPTFATAMEELASTPDANAPNRRAAL